MSWLPFILWVWFVVGIITYSRTDIGTAVAWPVVGAIRAYRAVKRAVSDA